MRLQALEQAWLVARRQRQPERDGTWRKPPERLEDLTAERIEAWNMTSAVNNRTKAKILTILNGVLKRARRVYKLPANPMRSVKRYAR